MLLTDRKLYSIFTERKLFIKLKRKQKKEQKPVYSIIRSTISEKHRHLFTSGTSNYDGYNRITKHFFRTLITERTIRDKIASMKFNNLQDFINRFESLMAEHTSVGGNRLFEDINSYFYVIFLIQCTEVINEIAKVKPWKMHLHFSETSPKEN